MVNGLLPFLDVVISRNNKGFTTIVYHKPMFSGVYSYFNSFMAEYKHGLISTLLFWIWKSKLFRRCNKEKFISTTLANKFI